MIVEHNTLVNALRIAADQYNQDAAVCELEASRSDETREGHLRTAKCFAEQRDKAREIADEIEGCGVVNIIFID